jgi:hypothetical protein
MSAEAPEAVPAAVVAGDPCYDRMLASVPHRAWYRRELGVSDGRTVVVVSSTWSVGSLLGSWPQLVRRLVAELPADAYRLVAVLHPNLVQGHGPFQVRAWLAECLRSGLTLIPPEHGWQAALLASDLVIGDYGAVTTYGAALGKPVLLGAFPDDEVVPGTAVHRLGQLAPRLRRTAPLRRQVEAALSGHDPDRYAEVADLVTSVPGESAQRLRSLFYRLLNRPEPAGEAMIYGFPAIGLNAGTRPQMSAALVACDVDITGRLIRLERFAAEGPPQLGAAPHPGRVHVAVHHAHPGRQLQRAAEVVFAYDDEIDDPNSWLARTLGDRPHCTVAAVISGSGGVMRHRRHGRLDITADAGVDPAAHASAALAWLDAGEAPGAVTVDVGVRRTRVSIDRSGEGT